MAKLQYTMNTIYSSLLTIFFLVLVSSCTGESDSTNRASHDGKDLSVDLSVPGFLAADLLNGLTLQAKALLDETQFSLDVNTDNSISGAIANVSPGNYQLKVIYFVNVASIDTNLAIYTTTVLVVIGETTDIIINNETLDRDIDDDKDYYTNLAEIRIGTNPHNSADRPSGESPLFSLAAGSMAKVSSNNFSGKFSVGEAVNGSATSTNFSIVTGADVLDVN